jgi:hypothetical protein
MKTYPGIKKVSLSIRFLFEVCVTNGECSEAKKPPAVLLFFAKEEGATKFEESPIE